MEMNSYSMQTKNSKEIIDEQEVHLTHYLYPSAIFADKKPYKVSTVLGTCVAVCLHDTKLNIGGINHYMLPLWNGEGLASPKYGNIAIEKLLEKMYQLGSEKKNLVAKVFGGKEAEDEKTSVFNIGKRNFELAIEKLKKEDIRIVSQSIGGLYGRKLLYSTNNGEVLMKFIKPIEPIK
jgi:chemotaxis protein CheD